MSREDGERVVIAPRMTEVRRARKVQLILLRWAGCALCFFLFSAVFDSGAQAAMGTIVVREQLKENPQTPPRKLTQRDRPTAQATPKVEPERSLPALSDLSIPDIVERLSASVVNIQSSFSSGLQSLGSGIVIDPQGLIVTNYHVVAEEVRADAENKKRNLASTISVALPDGRTALASIRGSDPATDLALLTIDAGNPPLPVVTLGDSDRVRVGEWVLAIGSPLGLDHTVTFGIVSAKGRTGIEGDFDDFLQTDAAINPGNSGGPLVNIKGEVIGINTLRIDRVQGLGFAIPVNILKDILPQLRDRGRVTRGYIGIKTLDTTPLQRQRLGVPSDQPGILVDSVPRGGPGAKSGLRRGDYIVKLDNEPVLSTGEFNRVIAAKGPGAKVSVTFRRDSKEYTLDVQLEVEPSGN